MLSRTKIPTLLGLAIITAGLIAGSLLLSTRQMFVSRADTPLTPDGVRVLNVTATSASVYWYTQQESSGFIEAGTSPALGSTFHDDRSRSVADSHRLHFITLTNLSPATTYYYKIHSGGQTYPAGSTLTFTTAKAIPLSKTAPLVGTVVTESYQPVNEALIILELPDAESLATVTRTAGNFVLPLSEVYRKDFTGGFPLNNSRATLKISDGNQSSQVTLYLPVKDPLPPIILGRDADLALTATTPSGESAYDLNLDGQVNSLDLSLLLKNTGKADFLKQADINNDGAVNKTDLEKFTDYLSAQSFK